MENSLSRPYEKTCAIPRQGVPFALAILYSLVIVALALVVSFSSQHNRAQTETIQELREEVLELRENINEDDKVVHFLNSLKRQGIDPKKLVRGD